MCVLYTNIGLGLISSSFNPMESVLRFFFLVLFLFFSEDFINPILSAEDVSSSAGRFFPSR